MVRPPARGEVWLVTLNPVVGHEQAGQRPAVVLSTDSFNVGPSGLILIAPLTGTERDVPFHVRVDPPEGGVRKRSFVKCEDVRSISKQRLITGPWGELSAATMELIVDRLRILLDIF